MCRQTVSGRWVLNFCCQLPRIGNNFQVNFGREEAQNRVLNTEETDMKNEQGEKVHKNDQRLPTDTKTESYLLENRTSETTCSQRNSHNTKSFQSPVDRFSSVTVCIGRLLCHTERLDYMPFLLESSLCQPTCRNKYLVRESCYVLLPFI